jgi:hypothetical protein
MTKCAKYGLLAAAVLSLCIAGCAGSQSAQPASPPPSPSPQPAASATAAPVAGIAAETVITVHGKIVKVDPATKQVTLEGQGGKDVTLTVNNP